MGCPGSEGIELYLGTGKGWDLRAGGAGQVGPGGESLCHPSPGAVGWAGSGHRATGPGQGLALCGVPG